MLGTKILEERKSKYNGHLRVLATLGMGRYIQSNGLTQSGGVVEAIWKQTLKHLRKGNKSVDNVLILGMGGGTVSKLISKIWPSAKITGVEIDPIMIELGKKYLELGKSGEKVVIEDAYGFDTSGYDLVIVDVYNADNFPEKFEREIFLRKLLKNRFVIFNRLYFGDKRPKAVKFGKKIEKIFTEVEWFYPEANLMFLCYNR